MEIDFIGDGMVKIDMKTYINDMIECFGEDVSRGATMPAQKDVFEINKMSSKLDEGKSDLFHTIMAKLLYISKRGRPDIQLAMAFLCTQVSCSTQQDWSKLQ